MSDEKVRAQEGWLRCSPGSRKFHYFINGGSESLCRRYGFAFGEELQPDNGKATPDDCAACRKKMERREADHE